MAQSTEQVMSFLTDLAHKARAQGQQEKADLEAFVREQGHTQPLQAWDIAYYSEKLKQASYAISDEMLRPYFPEDKVIAGLFEVVKRVFGLNIHERYGD